MDALPVLTSEERTICLQYRGKWRPSSTPFWKLLNDDLCFRRMKLSTDRRKGYVLWLSMARHAVRVYEEDDIAKQPNQIANYGTPVPRQIAEQVYPQVVDALAYGYIYLDP